MILNRLHPQMDRLLFIANRWNKRKATIPAFNPEVYIKTLSHIRAKVGEAQEKGASLPDLLDAYFDNYELLMLSQELSLLRALSQQDPLPDEVLAAADINPSTLVDYRILYHLEQFDRQLSSKVTAHSSNPFWPMAFDILITEQLTLCHNWLDPNGLKGTPDLLGILVCSLYYRHIAATVFDVKELAASGGQ